MPKHMDTEQVTKSDDLIERLDTQTLMRITALAILEAQTASEVDPNCCSDFGIGARRWERLADAADAVVAELARGRGYSDGLPSNK